jgi:hypothetical protein
MVSIFLSIIMALAAFASLGFILVHTFSFWNYMKGKND